MDLDDQSRTSRVLVVDDDESIRELICLALEDEGYEVLTAPEGAAAMEILAKSTPDLILLDTRMPGMNGWEFARLYHQREGHKAPLIVLSAADDPSGTAEDIGAEGYLAKPFDINDLSSTVRRFTNPVN
jgi:two-component system, chemotaxis family, chemotaxis protein CheY